MKYQEHLAYVADVRRRLRISDSEMPSTCNMTARSALTGNAFYNADTDTCWLEFNLRVEGGPLPRTIRDQWCAVDPNARRGDLGGGLMFGYDIDQIREKE